jgi:tRNA threonylcarbamoyladenosine biosynthesis protein TsaB
MKVLAVDTSSLVGTVALCSDGVLLAEWSTQVRASHGETLLPHVARVLEAAGVPLAEVDLIAVGLGPGSFTGVRIGLATAKGLALAERMPIVGVTSLAVLARGVILPGTLVIAAVDAYKDEVYAAAYRADHAGELVQLTAPFHAAPEQAAARLALQVGASPWVVVGNAAQRYGARWLGGLPGHAQQLPAYCDIPRGACLAHEAVLRFGRAGGCDVATLEPLYVRPSDAKLPGGIVPESA